MATGELVLVRHGETRWSRAGRHTGRSDLPLTEAGRTRAWELRAALRQTDFALVLTSPLERARETCELAGLGGSAEIRDDLREWDYGEYEGLTTAEIEGRRPGWSLWRDGCPRGETAAAVGQRADRVVDEARGSEAPVIVFGHGHVLRVLAVRWVGLPPENGRLLALDTGSLSTLGYEHELAVIRRWNEHGA